MSDILMPDSLSVPRSRPRGYTETLLGPLYVERPTDTPTVPLPVALLATSDYTPDRIRAGLSWVDQRLRSTTRKPSPLSAKALLIYRDTCTDALNTTDKKELYSLVSNINSFERVIGGRYWLGGVLNYEAQSIQDLILTSKKLEFNARYGDYVGRLCSNLGIETSKLKTEGYQLISEEEKWMEIGRIIKLKHFALQGYTGSPTAMDRLSTRTTDAFFIGCANLGLNPQLALWAVRQYAEQNDMMHASLDNDIKDQHYAKVASRLARDLVELPIIVPPEESEMESNIRTIIEALIWEWFDTSANRYEPGLWLATRELEEYCKLMKDGAEDGRVAREEHVRATAIVAENIRDREREDTQLMLLDLSEGTRS
ncbi:MAG: hypothetical protein M1840_007854 [Geoglossum simile]|nr:MAG: hypothetical protein M1840_007854 [Geoglossum simile]